MVITHAVETYSDEVRVLRRLALVCRTWHQHCAPWLYMKIRVPWSRVDRFYNGLNAPLSHASPYIKRLTLQMDSAEDVVDSLRVCRLSNVLGPHLSELRFNAPKTHRLSGVDAHRRTSQSTELAGTLASFQALTSLELCNMVFSSSHDLMRLFSSLPSLTRIGLYQVSWRKSLALAPFCRPSQLATMWFGSCSDIWPFMLCACYSRSYGARLNDTVKGISRGEARIAARICQYTGLGTQHHQWSSGLQFNKSAPYPQTCMSISHLAAETVHTHNDSSDIATMFLRDVAQMPRLELYMYEPDAETTTPPPSASSIRWVVFQTDHWATGEGAYFRSRKDIESINELLSQLPHLEKVVLQTVDSPEITHEMTAVSALLSNVSDRIHLQTWEEAQKYAEDVCDNGLPVNDPLPISPGRYVILLEPMNA